MRDFGFGRRDSKLETVLAHEIQEMIDMARNGPKYPGEKVKLFASSLTETSQTRNQNPPKRYIVQVFMMLYIKWTLKNKSFDPNAVFFTFSKE